MTLPTLGRIPRSAIVLLILVAFALATSACQDAGDWLVGRDKTPSAEPQPTPTPLPDSLAPYVGASIKDGRPYLHEDISMGALHYEPWVDYAIVQQTKSTLEVTSDVLADELGLAPLPPVEAYITWESQFNHFAGENQFQHPSWLAGFATYSVAGSQVTDAKVYVNAQAKGLVHNTAHELTHIAAPTLPQWLSEGVAEYVATLVEQRVNDTDAQAKRLQARQKVREAIRGSALLDPHALHQFPWDSPPSFDELDRAYALSWQLVEYLAEVGGKDLVSRLVTAYAADREETLATLEAVAGAPASEVWQRFSQHMLTDLDTAEQVGDALCRLSALQLQEAGLTQQWNEFLGRSHGQDVARFGLDFIHFSQEWALLLQDVASTPAPADAAPLKEAIARYLGTMREAMDLLAQGKAIPANSSLAVANQERSAAHALLHSALQERSDWLTCGAPALP
ncbi:MAG: hypothetical protein HY681_15510 [Chloroflexi bacterium]|nr:hypothetical protein [Chloroflexota bacterium]